MRILRTLVSAAIALGLAAVPAAAQDFKVIVNAGNSVSSLSAADLSKIFLKESSAFPGGINATPVDQSKASPVRAAFSKRIIGRSVAAVETHWQQQIFSGKDVPPSTKASDDEVVAFVKSTPGGIGYVSAGAAVAGVKVIEVK